jgi:hypothetical protein
MAAAASSAHGGPLTPERGLLSLGEAGYLVGMTALSSA